MEQTECSVEQLSFQAVGKRQIVALGPALPVWRTMADALGAPLVTSAGFDLSACPLVVAQGPQPADAAWSTLTAAVAEHATGLVFVRFSLTRARVLFSTRVAINGS